MNSIILHIIFFHFQLAINPFSQYRKLHRYMNIFLHSTSWFEWLHHKDTRNHNACSHRLQGPAFVLCEPTPPTIKKTDFSFGSYGGLYCSHSRVPINVFPWSSSNAWKSKAIRRTHNNDAWGTFSELSRDCKLLLILLCIINRWK